MITYTLGEKIGLKQDKLEGEVCPCGRGIIKRNEEGHSLYNVCTLSRDLLGNLEYVPSCYVCYQEDIADLADEV